MARPLQHDTAATSAFAACRLPPLGHVVSRALRRARVLSLSHSKRQMLTQGVLLEPMVVTYSAADGEFVLQVKGNADKLCSTLTAPEAEMVRRDFLLLAGSMVDAKQLSSEQRDKFDLELHARAKDVNGNGKVALTIEAAASGPESTAKAKAPPAKRARR